jgi:hypothetical protein
MKAEVARIVEDKTNGNRASHGFASATFMKGAITLSPRKN